MLQLEGVITPSGAVRISPLHDRLVLFWADKTVWSMTPSRATMISEHQYGIIMHMMLVKTVKSSVLERFSLEVCLDPCGLFLAVSICFSHLFSFFERFYHQGLAEAAVRRRFGASNAIRMARGDVNYNPQNFARWHLGQNHVRQAEDHGKRMKTN